MDADALWLAAAVKAVTTEARRLGLAAPAFRSPPRLPGAPRSVRRLGDGTVVAVRLHRPVGEVATDLIDGILVSNGLDGERAEAYRRALRAALQGVLAA
jgi:hypothetical protein